MFLTSLPVNLASLQIQVSRFIFLPRNSQTLKRDRRSESLGGKCFSKSVCTVFISPAPSTGQSQSQSCRLQSHDARSALSWRLQPSHPGLQHRAGWQRLGDHRHPGPGEGLLHGPDGTDGGHQERHGNETSAPRSISV